MGGSRSRLRVERRLALPARAFALRLAGSMLSLIPESVLLRLMGTGLNRVRGCVDSYGSSLRAHAEAQRFSRLDSHQIVCHTVPTYRSPVPIALVRGARTDGQHRHGDGRVAAAEKVDRARYLECGPHGHWDAAEAVSRVTSKSSRVGGSVEIDRREPRRDPDQERFVQTMGDTLAGLAASPSHGTALRIFLLRGRALQLRDSVRALLSLSSGAVSTAIRELVSWGLVRTIPAARQSPPPGRSSRRIRAAPRCQRPAHPHLHPGFTCRSRRRQRTRKQQTAFATSQTCSRPTSTRANKFSANVRNGTRTRCEPHGIFIPLPTYVWRLPPLRTRRQL